MNAFSYIVILGEANLNGSRLEHERNLASSIEKFPPKYDHLGQQQMVSNLDLSMAIPKTSKHHPIQKEDRDESRRPVRMDFLSNYSQPLKKKPEIRKFSSLLCIRSCYVNHSCIRLRTKHIFRVWKYVCDKFCLVEMNRSQLTKSDHMVCPYNSRNL